MNIQPLGAPARSTVLVVDDTPSILEMICELLQEDYEVLAAMNGSEALALAESEGPDLILLDVMMPGLDGLQVCTELKSRPGTAEIPVIFLTGLKSDRDETTGLQAGAVDYISKPINPLTLKARVRTHLEAKRNMDALRGLTLQDALTGIPNRRAFDHALNEEWERARRFHKPVSLVMIDIDHFKLYNDHFGHAQGDICLREVARALQGAMQRATDLVARYGGEEFVCLLPEADPQQALRSAEHMREQVLKLGMPHPTSPTHSVVSLSLGLDTMHPADALKPEHLLVAADHQLYEAKRRGRNQLACAALSAVLEMR